MWKSLRLAIWLVLAIASPAMATMTQPVTAAAPVVPSISATATSLPSGSTPTVNKSGTDVAPTFIFGIPKGDPGSAGTAGPTGAAGTVPVWIGGSPATGIKFALYSVTTTATGTFTVDYTNLGLTSMPFVQVQAIATASGVTNARNAHLTTFTTTTAGGWVDAPVSMTVGLTGALNAAVGLGVTVEILVIGK